MSEPSGFDIAQALTDALHAIHHPPPRKPVCGCGAFDYVENHGLAFPNQPNGLYCVRGHRLPGQDMPRRFHGVTDGQEKV